MTFMGYMIYLWNYYVLHVLARALTEPRLWTSCCWSSSFFQRQGPTKGRNRDSSSMPTATDTPFYSFFRSSWQGGSPRTWLTSWVCQTPATSGLLRSWTAFLLAVWFQTVGAITCTPFNLFNLNQIGIEELCVHGVIRSTWPSIAFMARMLRCIHWFWFDAIMSYTIHMTGIRMVYS